MSTYSSTMISDPKFQLLQRWNRLSEQISRARLSCAAVIRLNRSLDLAEEAVLEMAATDGDSERVDKTEDAEVSRLEDLGGSTGQLGEAVALLPSEPEYRAERISRQNPQESEFLFERLTHVLDMFRQRQRDIKVRAVTLHRSENFMVAC